MEPRAARVILALGAWCAVVALGVASPVLVDWGLLLESNLAPPEGRRLVMLVAAGAGVLGGLIGVVLVARWRQAGAQALEWLLRLLAPAVLLPWVVALTHRGLGTGLEVAALLAAVVLLLERFLRVSLEAWAARPPGLVLPSFPRLARVAEAAERFLARPRSPVVLVAALATAHAVFLSLWAAWAHARFQTYGYDLGQYDQLTANTLHGHWLAAATQAHPEVWGDLNGSHADFILFALLPVYALFPGAGTLLVLQVVAVASAAVPVFLFARRYVPGHLAFALAVAWLGYAPMHGALVYDFHTQPLGAAFVAWALWALETRRFVAYWGAFALALSCREDVALTLAAGGLFALLSGYRPRTGLASVVLAGAYFVVVRFGVMTSTVFANIYYQGLAAPAESGFGAVIQTLLSNPAWVFRTVVRPDKARYLAQLLAPLAFLPLRRPARLLLLAPAALLTLLTTDYEPTVAISFQYVFNWTPLAFAMTAVALGELPRAAQRAALGALLVGTLLADLQWGAYSPAAEVQGGFAPVLFTAPGPADLARAANLAALLREVPASAPLCTSDRVQPHTTAQHLDNWTLKNGLYACEYLLWSDLPGDTGADRGPAALADGTFVLHKALGDLHLARKAPPPVP